MNASTTPETLPQLAPRRPDSHKGDFGRVLVVAGSRGMAGAAALAGMAALRGGAGLVNLAVPECCQSIVAAFEPSYMVAGLPHDDQGRLDAGCRAELAPLASMATALACGPGLGQSAELSGLVHWLHTRMPQPCVLDADALNLLAALPEALARPGGPRILTPHPGELGRLLACEAKLPRDELERRAIELAGRCRAVVVLKGHRSLITDGTQTAHNATGNPGMATGGTGDVLTGLLAALLAQGLDPFSAARLGVHLHGLAGDLAAAEVGQTALIASDLIAYLPRAIEAHRGA